MVTTLGQCGSNSKPQIITEMTATAMMSELGSEQYCHFTDFYVCAADNPSYSIDGLKFHFD